MDENCLTVDILGIKFHKRNKEQVYEYISRALDENTPLRIFTPNPEIVYRATKEPELRSLLSKADLLLPDGIGVVVASRLLGEPLPCRITGIDTAEFILSEAEDRGLSVYLLGGAEGVALQAADRLRASFPRLLISGTHHGYFASNEESAAVISDISEKRPDLLFVCLGFPAQERFILETTPEFPSVRLSVGLGGCFDVWSGNKKRAPRVMQVLGLEWLFRIASEPRRLLRVPYILGFSLAVFKQKRENKSV